MILADAPIVPAGTLLERSHSLFGLLVFLLIAYAIGKVRGPRTPFPWRVVAWGVVLQFVFGAMVLFVPGVLIGTQTAIENLLGYTKDST